jgi:hypothetical protein
MMDARFKHLIAKPFMKFGIECNSIYPIIYMIPAIANALFLALLENSGIHNAMQYLFIDDVITRIQAYTRCVYLIPGRPKYSASRWAESFFDKIFFIALSV